MNMNSKTFGQRIKQIANEVGGNAELSKITNLSATIISRYISGKAEPTLHNLIAIAQAGNVDINWLALGMKEPTTEELDQEKTMFDDVGMMMSIVDDWLESNKLTINKDSRAELVVLLLEDHSGKTFDDKRIKKIQKQISRIVKIVKSEKNEK